MNNSRKEYPVQAAEHDFCSKWRHVYCYLRNRSRVGKKIKRGMNRRFRSSYKQLLNDYQKEIHYKRRNEPAPFIQYQPDF